jgi:DNA-binding response OmpR family regulator
LNLAADVSGLRIGMERRMQKINLRDVLLVDDDEELRDRVAACLRDAGVDVEVVANGAEALDRLRSASYALLLLDEEMLGVDGPSLLEELRERRPRPIVFVMSGSNDVRELAIDGSVVQAILHKPFDIAEVADVVKGCVTQFRRATATPSPVARRN